MTIFRAYDVRGVYPAQVNSDLLLKSGAAFGKMLGFSGTVAIGMDARMGGPELKKAAADGLTRMGVDVLDIGMVPTPLLYFATAWKKLSGGIMITASHNPKEYNGFKLAGKNGLCISYEAGLGEMERMVRDGIKIPSSGKGMLKKADMEKDYINFVKGLITIKKPLKIVVDGGNGSAGPLASRLFRSLGCDVIELYCEPDGNFPNHHPDPLKKENLKDLQERVLEMRADVGMAFDGDGDRVSFVDELGRPVEDNEAFCLMIMDALEKKPGARILYEVLCSKVVEDVIKSNGGKPVLSRVGHSYIEEVMLSKNCMLGGETSGHYYFRENYSYDDGLFAGARIIELLSKSGKPFSSMTATLPKYLASPETRIECADEKKFNAVERLEKKMEMEGNRLVTIDGVKVLFPERNSWFIVRASNTQPAIVVRWEASDKREYKRLNELVMKEVREAIGSV